MSAIDRILVDFPPAELIDIKPVAMALGRPADKHSFTMFQLLHAFVLTPADRLLGEAGPCG